MRLEGRVSSMKDEIQELEKRMHVIKNIALNVWFIRYLSKNKLELLKPMAHYIGLVEEWESKVRISRLTYGIGIASFFSGVLSLYIEHWSNSKNILSIALMVLALIILVVSFRSSSKTSKNAPYKKVVLMVRQYRKVLADLDRTVLWDDLLFESDDPVTRSLFTQLSELMKSVPSPARSQSDLPSCLVSAALSKLRSLGKQISELEGDYKFGEAAKIRNGGFATCFKQAILLGVIQDDASYGDFIPSPSH